MKSPVRVAITGAAGQIGYQLCFRIASGQMLGADQPIILQLIEIPPAMDALKGVVMELQDCAFHTLHGIETADNPNDGFKNTDYAILVGAKPRGPGMERADLLQGNAAIFSAQGKALNDHANPNCKVLVVGNPANTNALITLKNAPNLNPKNITAMTRLDHNRALGQLALKTDTQVQAIKNACIWGNHSSTQYPDIHHCTVAGKAALDLVDQAWIENDFIPTVQSRGGAIIKARGASSAASAASAAIDHMHDWALGTRDGDFVSMAILNPGDYGLDGEVIVSFPVTCSDGEYSVVQNLDINEFSRSRIDASLAELLDERDAVKDLI